MKNKARVAVFSPVNPVKSGISDYCEEFLNILHRHLDFSLYLDDYQPEADFIKTNIPFFDSCQFEEHQHQNPYDHIIWHIGNSPCHNYIYPFLYKYPGIMVLHDSWLLGTRLHKAVENWEGDQFRAEMKMVYGEKGESAAEIILCGLHNQTFLRHFPLHELQVRSSLVTVVHDSWLAENIMKENPGSTAMRVPHRGPLPQIEGGAGSRVRAKLNISQETFLLGSFGFIGPEKRIAQLLKAFKWMNSRYPDSRFLLVGKAGEDIDIPALINEFNLADQVILAGRLPEKEYFEYMNACNLVSALRWPTHRESSAAINSALFYGIPVITSDLVHLSDYPEETLFRIPLCGEEKILRETLLRLAQVPQEAVRRGEAGKKHLEKNHSEEMVKDAWFKILETAADKMRKGMAPDRKFLPQHLQQLIF